MLSLVETLTFIVILKSSFRMGLHCGASRSRVGGTPSSQAVITFENCYKGGIARRLFTPLRKGGLGGFFPRITEEIHFLVANAMEDQDKKELFRDMLIRGLAMSPVGAILCWFLFTVLGLP